MRITIETDDLDRLAHALLIAKAMYCADRVQNTSGAEWRWANGNIDALNALYDQLVEALETVEAG